MSVFEGDLARVLRSVESKRTINNVELEIILTFLGLLAIRNPAFRTQSGPFITSDHPVSLRWKHPEDIPPFYRDHPGFGLSDTQVVFPLSKSLALIGEFEDVEWNDDISSAPASPELVASINTLMIGTSRGQIYAPSFNFKFDGRGGIASGNVLLSYLK